MASTTDVPLSTPVVETWMDPIQLAAVLGAVVVLASMISVELGISVALLELGLGVVVGNLFHIDASTPWLTFVASFASIVLTFLAGAEVDPDDFRARFGASVTIGLVSFAGPFVVAWLISWSLLGWTLKASLIAGTALSTTSLAVVYAVLVETGLNATRIGKLIMSACFVTDMAPPWRCRRSSSPPTHGSRCSSPYRSRRSSGCRRSPRGSLAATATA
jgi:Kef-type K+ transport system membrane component KefB